MCGIVGAAAERNVVGILLEGLQRLEYRGYDSAGLTVLNAEQDLKRYRAVGKVQALKEPAELSRLKDLLELPIPAGQPMVSQRKPMPIHTCRAIRCRLFITASSKTMKRFVKN